ncbi:MAG: hypothetical protein KJ674_03745 [Nanoarchaeota archaeon]|nr:hypothetical protein [Nanoarchaeota archaeon]
MNKKGMFFTLITITMITMFIIFLVAQNKYLLSDEMFSDSIRINTMDEFVDDVEQDLERGLFISGFRSVLSMNEYVTNNGVFLNNAEDSFKEAFYNGSVNNQQSSLMAAATFPDWITNIKSKATIFNMNLELENGNLEVFQKDPWHITLIYNVTLNLTGAQNTASWVKNESIETQININGFEDPLYIINGYGLLTNLINQTIYSGNYTSGLDVSNLYNHVENSYYDFNPNAPNFLMRFENDLSSSSCCGIESFVNEQDFNPQQSSDKSNIDWIFFNPLLTPIPHVVSGMQSWFRIDSDYNHTIQYNV